MRKPFIAIILIFNIIASAPLLFASPQVDRLSVLYFFSSNCPHCARVNPVMKELSMAFPVQGFLYGKGSAEQMPFDVKKGNKALSAKYGVTGVPSLVVLQNSAFRMKLSGEHDIKDAPTILMAFKKGALSVSEVVEKGADSGYIVTGWIISRGEYFKDAKFFLTDRQKTVSLRPWLPLEAVKSRFKTKRPRLMSDVIGKPVMLRGDLVKSGDDYQFAVKEEMPLEER